VSSASPADEGLALRLDPDGVLRLVAMPTPRLSLTKVTSDARSGLTRTIVLEGTSFGMPADTLVRVTASVGSRSVELPPAKLAVTGSWAPQTEQPCTISVAFSLLDAGLFGQGSFGLALQPRFPHAPAVAAPKTFAYDHALSVGLTPAAGKARIGDAVVFQPTAHAAFASCHLEVRLSESDAGEKTGASEGELAVTLTWGGPGRPALSAAQTWRVGCDGAGHLAYAETNEAGDFEFAHEVWASADGKGWVPVRPAAPVCTVARPTLAAFALERRGKQVWAAGKLDGVSPDLAVPLGVTAWAHRPASWPDAGALRVMAPLRRVEAVLTGGAFEALLLDPGHPTSVEAAATGEGTRLFAVLDLKAGLAAAPLAAALGTDPAVFRPFGDGDLPRTTGRQKPEQVATTCCSSGTAADPTVVDVALTLEPHPGPPGAPAVEGWELVVRARLLGGDDAYWAKAAPRFEWQLGADTPVAVSASAVRGQEVVGRLALTGGWAGHGKSVRFRALATKEARLGGALVAPIAGAWSEPCACAPWLSLLPPTRKESGEVVVEGTSRYVPTTGSKFGLEAVFEAGSPAAPVSIKGGWAVAGADGRFRFELAPKAGGKLPTGKVRVTSSKKVGGLEVPAVEAVVSAP
jgi:hypothetical protein